MIGYSATHKAGAVAVPTNTRLAMPELVHQFGHAEVRVILCDTTLEANARHAADALVRDGVVDREPVDHRRADRRSGIQLGRPRGHGRVDVPGPRRPRRSRRHPLHVRHDRPPEGCRGPAPQCRAGPGRAEPELLRQALAPREPDVHLRRDRVHLQPDATRSDRCLPTAIRCRPMAACRRGDAADDVLPRAFDGSADSRSSFVRHRRPELDPAVRDRQRPACRPPRSSRCKSACPRLLSPTATG